LEINSRKIMAEVLIEKIEFEKKLETGATWPANEHMWHGPGE
jgi:hypothetical protein